MSNVRKKLNPVWHGIVLSTGLFALGALIVVVARGTPGAAETITPAGTALPAAVSTANGASSASDTLEMPKMIGKGYQFPVVLSDAQWHKRLDPEQYQILREQAPRPPSAGSIGTTIRQAPTIRPQPGNPSSARRTSSIPEPDGRASRNQFRRTPFCCVQTIASSRTGPRWSTA